MTFLVPTAFALAVIAIPITVLYILKLRMRQVHVSSDLFWQQIFTARPPRSFWSRFRHPLSWLAQLLILLAIVAAAADPRWNSTQTEQRLVLILDVSASMQASEARGQRLELARTRALQIINGLPAGTQVAVIAANHRPEILCSMTDHIPDLLRAVTSVEPSAAPGRPDLAVSIASSLLGDTDAASILLLSDRCFDATSLPAEPRLTIETVGTSLPNIGIVGFQALRNSDDPLSAELLVAVRNASSLPAEAVLQLRMNETLSHVERLSLAPEETTSKTFPRVGPAGGIWQAELREIRFLQNAADSTTSAPVTAAPPVTTAPVDALAIDNTAAAVLPAATRQTVQLISANGYFVQKVLEADPLIDLQVQSAITESPTNKPAQITILHELVPAKLPAGPVIVLDPRADCDAWALKETRQNPLPSPAVETHPITRNFRLDDVLIPAATELEFRLPARVLAVAEDGLPLCVLLQRPTGPVLVVPLQLTQSDLAFRTVFPILISNTLRWFANTTHLTASALQAGQQIAVPLPSATFAQRTAAESDIQQVLLRSPAGRSGLIPLVRTDDGSAELTALTGPLCETGLWSVEPTGTLAGISVPSESAVTIAVNVASAAESDLRPPGPVSEPPAADSRTPRSGSRPLWFWICCTAAFLLILEWFLYQRRWIT